MRTRSLGGSSPHTRGAPVGVEVVGEWARIIPAYAGSTPEGLRLVGRAQDHPRIRGEHASCCALMLFAVGSSPHTRGALEELRQPEGLRRIIPAYAGSTPPALLRYGLSQDHPRIRGEHSPSQTRSILRLGSSPHTRGARGPVDAEPRPSGIIPAYAGSTAKQALNTVYGKGSSPHTRGAREDEGVARVGEGIIPAYAGSTVLSTPTEYSSPDHPRIRGEHRLKRARGLVHEGSSPHTRGARRTAGKNGQKARIIPAYAGSTPSSSAHPRPRPRIIPAYAGSTLIMGLAAVGVQDHPRIRGEHRKYQQDKAWKSGSSPHTRGALHLMDLDGENYGIIPAYAGSTRVWQI